MSESADPRAIFNDRPHPEDIQRRYDLIRAPAKGREKAICLSGSLTGAYTHYWKGRTLPCNPMNCPACDEAAPRRWYGYLAIKSTRTNRIAILEITTSALDTLDRYNAEHKTLRGARLEFYRIPERANGRVALDLIPPLDPTENLPTTPDIQKQLLKMWETSWARNSIELRPGVPEDAEQTFPHNSQKLNRT